MSNPLTIYFFMSVRPCKSDKLALETVPLFENKSTIWFRQYPYKHSKQLPGLDRTPSLL